MHDISPTQQRTITDADADAIAERVAKFILAASQPTRNAISADSVYSVNVAASLLAMHPETLREKLRDGVVKGKRKHGGTWRVSGAELLKLA